MLCLEKKPVLMFGITDIENQTLFVQLFAKSLLSQIYKLVSRKAKQGNIFDEFIHEDNIISFKESIIFP